MIFSKCDDLDFCYRMGSDGDTGSVYTGDRLTVIGLIG